MSMGLYDQVLCHQHGGSVYLTAYASTNVREFFAELSVAYMCKDSTIEYNIDYPFNRTQLRKYDSASLRVIEQVWLRFEH